MRVLSRLLVLGIAGGAVFGFGNAVAFADDPPPIEEEYDYPNADQIFKERGILLKKGDGHILLVECAGRTDVVQVQSSSKGKFCFHINANTGYLSLELPDTYLLKGDGKHSLQATVRIEAKVETRTVPKTEWIGVGEGEGRPAATLLEFRAAA